MHGRSDGVTVIFCPIPRYYVEFVPSPWTRWKRVFCPHYRCSWTVLASHQRRPWTLVSFWTPLLTGHVHGRRFWRPREHGSSIRAYKFARVFTCPVDGHWCVPTLTIVTTTVSLLSRSSAMTPRKDSTSESHLFKIPAQRFCWKSARVNNGVHGLSLWQKPICRSIISV